MSKTGRVVWDYIEEQARKKLAKNGFWKLREAEILDSEIARAVLQYEFLPGTYSGKAECLVVYEQKGGADDDRPEADFGTVREG